MKRLTQPDGAFPLFFVLLFSSVGYAYVYSVLLLYVIQQFSFADSAAYAIAGAFTALSFATSLFGGYLAGRFLGYRFAIALSLFASAMAFFVMLVPTELAMYWALSFLVCAQGVIIPSAFVLLGRLYERKDPRRLGGFMLIYVGMNVGAFFAEASAGSVGMSFGYRYNFFIGGIASLIALFIFVLNRHTFSQSGYRNTYYKVRPEAIKRSRLTGLCFLMISLPIMALMLHFADFTHIAVLVIAAAMLVFVWQLSKRESLFYRRRIWAYLIFILFSFCFLIFYMLIPSLMVLFIHRNVFRTVFGHYIHTAAFLSINPFFIVVLGFCFIWLNAWFVKRKFTISVPVKFVMGGFFMGFGYLLLLAGIQFANLQGLMNAWWVVASYFFQTVAELLIVPVTFSVIGELVPIRLEGLMMGVWLFFTGSAASAAVFLTDFVRVPKRLVVPVVTNSLYGQAFLIYGATAIILSLIMALLIPILQKLMSQEKIVT